MSSMEYIQDWEIYSEPDACAVYTKKDWDAYLAGKIHDEQRREMTDHLAMCDTCLNTYVALCEADSMYAPDLLARQVMGVVSPKRKVKKRQIVLAYAAAACVALVLFSLGTFNLIPGFGENVIKLEQQLDQSSFEWGQSIREKVKEKQKEDAHKEKENRKNRQTFIAWGEIFQ